MKLKKAPILDYAYTEWLRSSQAAWNIYNAGQRLWTKEDLRDIEKQLAQGNERECSTVRMLDGRMAHIKNPMFGERSPIWKAIVKFQDLWQLVLTQPQRPPDTYHCSYLVHWERVWLRAFRDIIEDWVSVFEENKVTWNKSTTCSLFKARLREIFSTGTVTKVVCFGLGNMCRKPPETAFFDWRLKDLNVTERDVHLILVRPSMIQHCTAQTVVDMCYEAGTPRVELLVQDPSYTVEAKKVLAEKGFSVVGEFVAGGFAEVDEDTVVVTFACTAPVKQIIADIARPRLVIGRAARNLDSPRTRMMIEDYDTFDFPVSSEDYDFLGEGQAGFFGAHLWARKTACGKKSALA